MHAAYTTGKLERVSSDDQGVSAISEVVTASLWYIGDPQLAFRLSMELRHTMLAERDLEIYNMG